MRDVNFFSAELEEQKISNRRNLIISAIILALLLSVAGAYFYIEMVVSGLDRDITAMKTYLSSAEVSEKLGNLAELQTEWILLSEYDASVDKITDAITKSGSINSGLIGVLSKAVPAKTVIRDMECIQTGLTISGDVTDRIEAAEFLHNLKMTGLFKDVYLNILQGNVAAPLETEGGGTDIAAPDLGTSEKINFTVQCTFKDVN